MLHLLLDVLSLVTLGLLPDVPWRLVMQVTPLLHIPLWDRLSEVLLPYVPPRPVALVSSLPRLDHPLLAHPPDLLWNLQCRTGHLCS